MRTISFILMSLAVLVLSGSCDAKPKQNDASADASVSSVTSEAAESAKASVKEIDAKEYNDLFKSGKPLERPALIDFNAEWCGPCQMLAPHLKTLAKKYQGKLDVYSINIDNNRELAEEVGIEFIPFLQFITTDGKITQDGGYKEFEELDNLVREKFGF